MSALDLAVHDAQDDLPSMLPLAMGSALMYLVSHMHVLDLSVAELISQPPQAPGHRILRGWPDWAQERR